MSGPPAMNPDKLTIGSDLFPIAIRVYQYSMPLEKHVDS